MKGGGGEEKEERKSQSLMGFGDKKLPAPGPSLLSLAWSSVAEPIREFRSTVTVETREHSPWRRHGKQGSRLLKFFWHTDTHRVVDMHSAACVQCSVSSGQN